MKFEITDQQGESLRELQNEELAANRTLNVALAHHSSIIKRISDTTEVIWSEIVDTHELDLSTHNYELIEDAGKFFVAATKPEKPK